MMFKSDIARSFKGLAAIVSIVAMLAFSVNVSAQDTQEQEAKRARLQKEIENLDIQIRENAKKSNSAIANVALLGKKINVRKELINDADKQISDFAVQINEKQQEIKVIQARYDTLSFYYARLVKNAYKNRDSKVWYMYLLSSENLGQAFRRISYLKDLSRMMNEQAKKIKETKAELEAETLKLNELKRQSESVRSQKVQEMSSLQQEQDESQKLVKQLQRNKSQYQRELTQKQRQVQVLNREIERIIREAMEQKAVASKKSGQSKSSTPTRARIPIDYKLAGEFAANRGRLPWPASGSIVDHFGQRYHPVFTRVQLPFNNGVTVEVPRGTRIKAVFNGVVSQIVVIPGYNQCVLVQHGNYFSFYCKLASVSVRAGDKVKTGETIGTVDTINGETQYHLQIWSGRSPQNPESWLRPM
jgi:septal ring factor EnvC (AmiA/AmiB activator)